MTSQPTEPNHIQQTLSLGAFHAPTSQSLEGEKGSRRLQGLVSGSNSSEPYALYDQSTSSWKTCQRSLLTGWTSYSGTFTRQGYMSASGAVFQAALLGLAINEIDGGLLPTPLASNPDREMLPTPTTMDHLGQRSPEALKKQMEGARKGRTTLSNLREAVNPQTVETFNNLIPTPRAAIGMGMKLSKGMANLEHKKYLETEIAADLHKSGEVQNTDSTQTGNNMYLNPQFVEEMMGYPLNWTLNNEFKDLKC